MILERNQISGATKGVTACLLRKGAGIDGSEIWKKFRAPQILWPKLDVLRACYFRSQRLFHCQYFPTQNLRRIDRLYGQPLPWKKKKLWRPSAVAWTHVGAQRRNKHPPSSIDIRFRVIYFQDEQAINHGCASSLGQLRADNWYLICRRDPRRPAKKSRYARLPPLIFSLLDGLGPFPLFSESKVRQRLVQLSPVLRLTIF